MNTEKSKIYGALAKAQGEFDAVLFDKVNPHFKSKYASLSAIRKAVQPSLSKHNLSLTQEFNCEADGTLIINTRLAHEEGEFIDSKFPIKVGNETMQQIGSKITYARRYAISALLNVNAEEEDDGEEDRKAVSTMFKASPKKEEEAYISSEKINVLERLTANYSGIKEGFLAWKGIKSYSEIKESDYERCVTSINKKLTEIKAVKNEDKS